MKLNEITSAIIGAAIKAQELVLKDGLNSSFALFGPCRACSVEPMILHYKAYLSDLPPIRPARPAFFDTPPAAVYRKNPADRGEGGLWAAVVVQNRRPTEQARRRRTP